MALDNLSYFEHIPQNFVQFLFWKECLIKNFMWPKKFYHKLKWSPWILTNDLQARFMLHGLAPVHFFASLLLGPNFGQSKFHHNMFLLKSLSFFLFLKNHLTSKHFYLHWKPSSTAVCFSSVTPAPPLDLGSPSRIYSFPMFS